MKKDGPNGVTSFKEAKKLAAASITSGNQSSQEPRKASRKTKWTKVDLGKYISSETGSTTYQSKVEEEDPSKHVIEQVLLMSEVNNSHNCTSHFIFRPFLANI